MKKHIRIMPAFFMLTLFFIGSLGFAQTFDSSKLAIQGLISAVVNRDDVKYEILTTEDNGEILFNYTWTQETKILLLKSYQQYRCLLSVKTIEKDGQNALQFVMDPKIWSRAVEADGSPIPANKRSSKSAINYEWGEATGILNKISVLTSTQEQIEKDLLFELNKSQEELSKALLTFFSDLVNLTYISTDSLVKLATENKALCSNPAILGRLKNEKSELWFNNFVKNIIDTPVSYTFKLNTVRESKLDEYKYRAEFFFHIYKDYTFSIAKNASYRDRKSMLGGSISNMDIINVHYYTNDDKLLDYNKDAAVNVTGTLKDVKFDVFNSIIEICE